MKNWVLLFLLLMYSIQALAERRVYNEVGTDFSYSKSVYGTYRQNAVRNRVWSSSYALYFMQYTAFELNHSYSKELVHESHDSKITGTDFSLVGFNSKVQTEVFGLGLRQAFAGSQARFKPTLSLGYAKQFVHSQSLVYLRDDTTNVVYAVLNGSSKRRSDSVFGTFALQWRLMGAFFLKGSVRTVFPAFKPDLAKDYLTYTAGLVWVF